MQSGLKFSQLKIKLNSGLKSPTITTNLTQVKKLLKIKRKRYKLRLIFTYERTPKIVMLSLNK